MASKGNRDGDTNTWLYDILLWIFSICLDLFFREVHPRSCWKVPRSGPVIFVGAPHANQFIDPIILMRVLRLEAKRRVAFLIAEKSLHRKWVGWFAKSLGAVGVGRALDSTKSATGKIYLPDPDNDPTLVRGVETDFKGKDFEVGGLIVLPTVNGTAANCEIGEIVSQDELRLKKPFKGSVALAQMTGRQVATEATGNGKSSTNSELDDLKQTTSTFKGTQFKVAPKIDQTKMYDAVHTKLRSGGCIGIYPEGGSHDRTELLPLKAGVAVMALGVLAHDPNCDLKIVPCGMNYFHAHKFRSRAVVEFGTPIEVPNELVEEYKNGSRREAVGRVLEMVYNALVAVTVTSPDYDTLMLIQAVRRLYNPKGKKLPLPVVVELNRRLVKGYTQYRDDPRIIKLKKNVLAYNKQLLALNVRDHQVEYAKLSIIRVLATLLYRLGKLIMLSAGVLPGLVLFAPVFIAGKAISIKKSREALAASTVKIQARDVIATWKLLVSLALAPILYNFYTIILAVWTYRSRVHGLVPKEVPLWAVFLFGYIIFPALTFAALRFGEIGMDIAKSLRPLFLSLSPSSGNTLVRLRAKRAQLVTEVTDLINELGPEVFPDFEENRLLKPDTSPPSTPRGRDWSDMFYFKSRDSSPDHGDTTTRAGHVPRNDSLSNFANIGLFSSRPQTPRAHSRNRSSGKNGGGLFGLRGFSTIDSKEASEDVSRRIRGAMKERGRRRESDGAEENSDYESEPSTPGSNGLAMKKIL